MLAVTMMTACKQRTETAGREPEPQPVAEDTTSYDPLEDEIAAPAEPVKAPQSSYFDQKVKSSKPAGTQVTKPAAKGPAETIYVEADDSHGRVWGHVTMRGDRGTGTIHDEGENTWAVSVTRHGNELYAVDQNSRQYVFKVKQK
jgi:hypothetical protein